jgi:hypothetical protein
LLAGLAAGAIALTTSKGSLTTDPTALARVSMPLGGGRITSVSAVTGPHSKPVPVTLRGRQVWPLHSVPAGELISLEVVIKRPGSISWLVGDNERLRLDVTAPTATVSQRYVTIRVGSQVPLTFTQPVSVVFYGPVDGSLHRLQLPSPQTTVALPRPGLAGTMQLAATPRTWETANPITVSWFPAGATAVAVANPVPGTKITPGTPITLTFSKPVNKVLGSSMPPVSPTSTGAWRAISSHSIQFLPAGYGYGLGATVTIGLPAGVRIIGAPTATWTVPPGSPLRAQQLLAQLGYLPLSFTATGQPVANTPEAQLAAAVDPPRGTFTWRYQNVPDALRSFWQPGASGVMTRGAMMAFQTDHGLSADGVAGLNTWRALLAAAINPHPSSFGYTFVSVSEASQRLSVWHNGRTVLATPVNTGIASAPTATGTYPVYEHVSSGTMSGTNPDGSHYHDPGVPWISYFNGGDALHGFYRAQYGFPQSLGCVEMPVSTAGQVWPYTPIGTLVHVA